MNHSQSEHAFEPLTRTSLQSFRLLLQNLCKAHPVEAAEITRTSLQLFSDVLVYDYYFVLFEARDCVLHIQDDFSGTPSDTRVQDNYPSISYCETSVKNDTLNFFWLLPYWLCFYEHSDMPLMDKTFALLFWDYVALLCHNEDM
ncbi:MAG: hypothetical protein JW704_04665 [Anaerolineaceae bacterium]|nr:hypothetical protein [Anaerolineaceae bacterium]